MNYLNIYDGLILAANGNHGLYVLAVNFIGILREYFD